MNKSKVQLSLRDRNFAKTRFNILQAFIKLIVQKGYENITVDDVCNIAEISRGTFFNYFPSKEHIYTYYGWWFCAKLLIELNSQKNEESSSYDKIKFVFNFTVKEDKQYANQMPLFVSHILRRDPYISKEVEYTRADFLYQFPNYKDLLPANSPKISLPTVGDIFIKLINEGIQKKEFKSDINAQKVVLHLLSIYFSPPIVCKFMGQECSLEGVYSILLDDALNPILNKDKIL